MGMFFKYVAVAPDILGYVSTLISTNDDSQQTWSALEAGTTFETMDGLDRARLLRDVNVQIVTSSKGEEGRNHVWLKTC